MTNTTNQNGSTAPSKYAPIGAIPPVSGKPKRKQPSRAAKQRVRDAIDTDLLIDICERDALDFTDYATRVDLEPGYAGRERFFYYKDNGSKILAVAHLDTVQQDRQTHVTETAAGLLVTSGALDDRLGAYVILDVLPKLGINVDWLLTTDEEKGASTADEFWPDHKTYNWMIEFDRGGTDVVMYQYETPELRELVEASTATVGDGIFSDIAVLDHLGCAGFNWGVGYQDYHSPRGHAWLEDTIKMVARFEKFYRANHDTHLAYDERDQFAQRDDHSDEWWESYRDSPPKDVDPFDDDWLADTIWDRRSRQHDLIDPFDDLDDDTIEILTDPEHF